MKLTVFLVTGLVVAFLVCGCEPVGPGVPLENGGDAPNQIDNGGDGNGPQDSPRADGAELLFSAYSPSEPNVSAQNAAFSPDGTRVVFTLFLNGYNIGPAELWIISADGSNAHRVTPVEDQDNVNVPGGAWNAVTDEIVFSSDRQEADDIWAIQPDGSGFRRITEHTPPPFWIEPVWSPDGEWIVFESDGDAATELEQRGTIFKVRSDGTELTQLTGRNGEDLDDRLPNWSPDGQRILFQRRDPSAGAGDTWDIYVIDTDGGALLNVSNAAEHFNTDNSWAPDGRWIASSSEFPAGGEQLRLPNIIGFFVPADGADANPPQPVRITFDDGHEDGAASVSPDGRRVAFESHRTSDEQSPSDLWIIPTPEVLMLHSENAGDNVDDGNPPVDSSGHLIVDGVTVRYGAETLDITGNVIVSNGGELILDGTTLNIISSFDEEFTIQVLGQSSLQATDAVIQGRQFQTALIAEPDDDGSPTLEFTDTTVTFHAGIRPFGDTRITATNSNVEEVQVHDRAVVSITGGEGLYPVFFFAELDGELTGLTTSGLVTRTVDIEGGWSFSMTGVDVVGYQIDVEGLATVTLLDCESITASLHTTGNLGSDQVTVENVTTQGAATGEITGLGAEIVYRNTAVDLFNVYVADRDIVRVRGGIVNEANTEGASQLTIEDCTVQYNLVQAYEDSVLIIENCAITAELSTQPSLTAEDNARITVRNSDCARLEAQAIGNARIDFLQPRNLDRDSLAVQDNGEIYIDGQRVR